MTLSVSYDYSNEAVTGIAGNVPSIAVRCGNSSTKFNNK